MSGAEVKSPEKGLFSLPQLVCILWPFEPPKFQDNVLLLEPYCEFWVTCTNNDYLLEFSDASGLKGGGSVETDLSVAPLVSAAVDI